jgi:hypothetical protein
MFSRKTVAIAAGAVIVLAACGGSDEDTEIISPPPPPPPAPTAVPDSAVASSTSLVSYLKAQKTDDETTEALTLPTVAVAVSETEEPVTL